MGLAQPNHSPTRTSVVNPMGLTPARGVIVVIVREAQPSAYVIVVIVSGGQPKTRSRRVPVWHGLADHLMICNLNPISLSAPVIFNALAGSLK